jgi:hypothetical protein
MFAAMLRLMDAEADAIRRQPAEQERALRNARQRR